MKKIGLITFHRAHNYGSVLQTYALSTTLNQFENCKCEVIDFSTKEQNEMYSLYKKNNSIKNIIKNIMTFMNHKMLKNRYRAFEEFLNNNIKLSLESYQSVKQLKKVENEYGILVCGSDQIWNVNTIDFDEAYFLTFSDKARKISYAPSLGGQNPIKDNTMENRIKNYLEKFDAISVRENRGSEIIKNITNKKVETVLDPTFLLNKQEWDKLASDRIINEEYIFFYSIHYNSDEIQMAKRISKQFNKPIVVIFSTNRTYKTLLYGFKMTKCVKPEDFLSLIKYANLVISTSFHGTVFSIIFRKPFYAIRGNVNGKINDDDRLITLLTKLNLREREINISSLDNLGDCYNIEYRKSEEYITNEIENSIKYLRSAISN